MRHTLMIAAILLLLTCAETVAQNTIYGYGYGNSSCGAWLEARRQNNPASVGMRNWVLGFLTAYNLYGSPGRGDVLHGTDAEGAWAWLDKHCRDNPTESLFNAAERLIKHLESR